MRNSGVFECAAISSVMLPATSFSALILSYLESHLKGKPSYEPMRRAAAPWILTLQTTPTRVDLLARHRAKCAGHYQPGATTANTELALVRAACRWGAYQECWDGGDPTLGIKKWKTPKRKRIGRYQELGALLFHFDRASSPTEIRDRALFGLQLFTGCRTIEARTARVGAIQPYGTMGCWVKPTTKNGQPHEIPVPSQMMAWLQDWMDIRPQMEKLRGPNPYLFPGQHYGRPMTENGARSQWAEIRNALQLYGLWSYDLRRTLASYLSNELDADDKTIQAILNHYDGRALSHYVHKTFDSLTGVIQGYADWLLTLKDARADQTTVRAALTRHADRVFSVPQLDKGLLP